MKLKELQLVNNKVKGLAKKERKHFYYGRFVPNTTFMFVAEIPTDPKDWDPTDNFNLKSDENFLKHLNKNGFGGSYITDIVKTTAESGMKAKDNKKLSEWLKLLAKELEHIHPKVVIAVGKETFEILDKRKVCLNIKNLDWIYHPAWPKHNASNMTDFIKRIVKISKKYKNIN